MRRQQRPESIPKEYGYWAGQQGSGYPRVLRECRKRRICVFITGLRPRCRLASGPTAAISCFIHALPRSEGDADVAAIRCLSPLVQSIGHHGAYGCQGSMAGTDNFAPASFRVGPHGDFRIHIGYLAAASLAATGPAVVICRSHAWPWPEENADVADVCCRGLPVHRVGHLVQNVMRIMEMPSGIAIEGRQISSSH